MDQTATFERVGKAAGGLAEGLFIGFCRLVDEGGETVDVEIGHLGTPVDI